MGQVPRQAIMNPNTSARSPGYHQKAMEEIQNSLRPFAKSGSETVGSSAASTISSFSQTSGISSLSSASGSNGDNGKDHLQLRHGLAQLLSLGYSEDSSMRALQGSNGRVDLALDYLIKQLPESSKNAGYSKLIRKPSIERELVHPRGSPALDSGAGSSRSDSPRMTDIHSSRYSPSFGEPPPPPPPRTTPPPPPPHAPPAYQQSVPNNVQQMFKRMSPAPPVVPNRAPPAAPGSGYGSSAQRGTSPVGSGNTRQPMVVQNGPQVQQQLTQQMQALSLYPTGGVNSSEPPPPYPLIGQGGGGGGGGGGSGAPPPPSYSASIQNRQSPTQDFRKSPSSGIYSGSTSAGSPSPVPVSNATTPTPMARPTPLQAWGARQTVSQPPIIMQSVKSTQVQKPVLQTATAPPIPATSSGPSTPPATAAPPPSYNASIQQKVYTNGAGGASGKPAAPLPSGLSNNPGGQVNVPTTEPPSYASTMQAKAKARVHPPLPPPPYTDDAHTSYSPSGHSHPPLQRKYSPAIGGPNECCRADSPLSTNSGDGRNLYPDNGGAPPLPPTASSSVKTNSINNNNNGHATMNGNSSNESNGSKNQSEPPPQLPPYAKIKHQSPIPERKKISKEKEEERRDGKVKNYSPQAFKFFMEQHIENVIKSYRQRQYRRMQLEKEMVKIGLSSEAQQQMRKMLSQKESNYIRLKRAKMDNNMFETIKPIGVGAFGEVKLVRKIDTNHLYAMKTLRKADVLKRNQVAHVKAERDILAEADNEWVVKLYYSFQDSDVLYFVMDYIPGGDLMSLLIKKGIFPESLARFYIAELTCAVESVHRMGFIHRDIKPDNILIDKDGHIKLTDFGLCTGFRWTHNSKYYQPNDHSRQDSMDPIDDINEQCKCAKPLERRKNRERRCLAHSLVGTPNYIAPEVLQRTGYTHVCDWWSVGVILYEMLVGQPPFLANTPAETQYKVINWETTLQIPKQANLTKEATDLILKLCCGADKRLGRNANEIKSHSFFKEIDFDKGLRRQPAPYKPRIDNPTDTSNFDPIDPDRLRSMDSSNSSDLNDNSKLYHGFFEFTFRRFFDDGGVAAFNKINLDDNENQGGPVYV
ncbi:serine/threonine-protein kinase Warts isoform X2 [Anthonomus grandis grandis]|uniref:serine/threonine-protein kinase Warts isoform X2 n=1 Tax=Anthonomus grandis grandis TaxID=2921223 RepID=UPI00216587F6|nr:serine/threonine-protein kinase Warts isoform X2 [Anthonomus grandis grandis]